MRRFTSLIVALAEAGGDAAAQYAARLAARAGAALTLADVVENVPRFVRPLLPRGWNVPKLVRAQKQASLERSAARLRRSGVDPKIVLLAGPAVKALVREVVRRGHDLLVTEVESVGSIAALVREAPCPVLFVRPSQRRRRPRILVAVDAGPWQMKAADRVSAELLKTAVWFADIMAGELHVLHVWAPYAERFMQRAGLTAGEMGEFVDAARQRARQALEATIAPFRDHIEGVHLVKGMPKKEIAKFAAAHRVDLLVIGTVARTGLAARLIGNTAEAVLGALPCSILVVRPPSRSRGP